MSSEGTLSVILKDGFSKLLEDPETLLRTYNFWRDLFSSLKGISTSTLHKMANSMIEIEAEMVSLRQKFADEKAREERLKELKKLAAEAIKNTIVFAYRVKKKSRNMAYIIGDLVPLLEKYFLKIDDPERLEKELLGYIRLRRVMVLSHTLSG